jgi:hypothetical protein
VNADGRWTNPVDLYKYIIETQLSFQGKSNKVLTAEMTKLRLTPVLQEAALGVFVSQRGSVKYFMHNGGNAGFSCQATACLDGGNGVVVMTNSDNGSILEEIVNSVAIVYKWKDYYQPVTRSNEEVPEKILNSYSGKYDPGGGSVATRQISKSTAVQ